MGSDEIGIQVNIPDEQLLSDEKFNNERYGIYGKVQDGFIPVRNRKAY